MENKVNESVRTRVVSLLESYREREKRIALLRYELRHPAHSLPDEMIWAMSSRHGEGNPPSKGHISNKTLYIALNYQDQVDKVNAEVTDEIVAQLVQMEGEQDRINYYVSQLEPQEKTVIRRFYFEGETLEVIARENFIALRTVYKVKNRAVDRLASWYEFAEGLT